MTFEQDILFLKQLVNGPVLLTTLPDYVTQFLDSEDLVLRGLIDIQHERYYDKIYSLTFKGRMFLAALAATEQC
jgi:hypothetical protein